MSVGRIVREPLLHFLLIGLALFLYHGHVASGSSDDRRIVVTQLQVDDLAQQFQRTWNRPPTAPELLRLVDSYIHDEVLYRQGMAAGLGRDDVVIKRRIRQKIEVMAEEDGLRATPTDSDLESYLRDHPEKFVRPAVVSFEQLYFDPAAPGTQGRIDAAKAALAAGRAAAGQPSMLPRRIDLEDLDAVARDFGAAFAATLSTLPAGQWAGPVTSGLGVHLVRIGAWAPAALPPLPQVRAQVQREWENDRRQRALDASYQKERANYEVVIKAKLPSAQ